MPRNQFQRMVFAFLTVVITVHAYVFYSLYVVNGTTLMEINNASGVIEAINNQGGVLMFGRFLPIWAIILIEFVCAYVLEVIMGSPLSFKLAAKIFDMKTTHHMIFETAIICATVGLMCPAMSFLAAFFYYPYYEGFNVINERHSIRNAFFCLPFIINLFTKGIHILNFKLCTVIKNNCAVP